jgi:hypothetical protein
MQLFTKSACKKHLTAVNFEMVNGRAMIVQRDYSKNPEKYKKGTVWSYSAAKNRCRKIVSFYTAYVNTEKRIISEFSKNMSDEFGEYGVLILDRQQLFSRINDVFRKMKNCKEAQMGFVEYQTMSSGLNEWNPFRKDIDKFGYQNEFRITFVDDSREAVLLDLNQSLRDIAIPIIASEVDKEIYFDGKNLVYPIYKEIEI